MIKYFPRMISLLFYMISLLLTAVIFLNMGWLNSGIGNFIWFNTWAFYAAFFQWLIEGKKFINNLIVNYIAFNFVYLFAVICGINNYFSFN